MPLTTSLVRLFSHVSRRRRWQLGGLLILMLVGTATEMATLGAVVPFLALLADPSMADKYPLLNKVFGLLGGSSDNMLLSAAILFGVIAVIAGLVRMLLMWVSLRITFGLGADIGGEVYRRTLHQPYRWHVSRNSSEILASIDKVNSIVYGIITPLTQGIVSVVLSVGILSVLLAVDAQTALIAGTGFSVLYGITTVVLRRQVLRNGKIISANLTHRVQAVQEGLGGIRDVLLDGTQPIYHRRFAMFDYAMRRAQAANGFIGASPRYIIEAAGMVLIVGLAYGLAGRYGGLSGAIPILGALAIGAQKLLPQMQLVYSSWASIIGTRNQLEDILELLESPIALEHTLLVNSPARTPKVNSEAEQKASGSPLIALKNISFRYKTDSHEVLRNIDLEIPRGARVGFIGKTGSGKSTLIDIIMGLLEPTAGEIEVDGQPLIGKNRRVWQLRIAHVPQSIYLSDASIAENIAFGVPAANIDYARVKMVATKAQLTDFIDSMPCGYNTSVGERGVRLSGGQRQRIGLARALYKQADVLVLDEATSALDDTTEQSVMAAIKTLSQELTVLMIAHRVSTLRDCNMIVELSNSSVSRVGDYAEVIESPKNSSPSVSLSVDRKHA